VVIRIRRIAPAYQTTRTLKGACMHSGALCSIGHSR
jgi:hypothetical protein